MKRKIVILLCSIVLMVLFSGTVIAEEVISGENGMGPADDSGDCVPNETSFGNGGAPNSGDGVPDGSGW